MALGPALPSIQWVPGAIFTGVKWQRCEDDHSPLFSAEVRMVELYFHSSIDLYGIVLN
jgi:hypothetical protein